MIEEEYIFEPQNEVFNDEQTPMGNFIIAPEQEEKDRTRTRWIRLLE